jgi:hypothetical protein
MRGGRPRASNRQTDDALHAVQPTWLSMHSRGYVHTHAQTSPAHVRDRNCPITSPESSGRYACAMNNAPFPSNYENSGLCDQGNASKEQAMGAEWRGGSREARESPGHREDGAGRTEGGELAQGPLFNIADRTRGRSHWSTRGSSNQQSHEWSVTLKNLQQPPEK